MTSKIQYARRTSGGLLTTACIAELLDGWRGPAETWLFVSPHDDDIVLGGGLVFQAGIAEGAQVHAAVVTDGRMGYCRIEQRESIAAIRGEEARKSFAVLGLPADRLYFLGYPDGQLTGYSGAFIRNGNAGTPAIKTVGLPQETVGLQIAFTRLLRQVRPTRVFVPTSSDLHPDHRIVHEQLMISLFHAQGGIWPQLGEPLAGLPQVYELAIYCDFPEPPQICVEATQAMLETKIQAIMAYGSQEQISSLVEIQRATGPVEYLRELKFRFYSPKQYNELFARTS
jgi:LmbE family N-acetylglucosaminyl deacetylase